METSWGLISPKGACKKDRDKIFGRACFDRTRGHGFKLREGQFRLNIRKNFLR